MIRRPQSLLFVAMSAFALSNVAQAQLTVNLPSVDFNDATTQLPTPGSNNPNNQIYTATVGSGFTMSSSVNQLAGGTLDQDWDNFTTTTTCGFRISNSAFPGNWADFSLSNQAWSITYTANITAATRSAAGPLVNTALPGGSTMSFEAYNSLSNGAQVDGQREVLGTNIGFTLNSATFTSTVVATFAYSGLYASVNTGSLTSGSQFTAAASGSQYILGAQTLVNSLTIHNVHSSNQGGDLKFSGENSAYPGLYLTITPWNSAGGYLMGENVTRSFAGIGGNATGTLAGGVINPGSNWTWYVYDGSDAGADGVADFGVENLSFSITGTTFSSTYDSGVIAGTHNAGGALGSADNSTVTLPAVGATFIMGSTVVFHGTATKVHSSTVASELRVRIRNSAYPTLSLDFQPTPASFVGGVVNVSDFQVTTPSPREVYFNRMQNTLRGMSMASGSTFTAEFWDNNDNGAGADATWSNVRIRFQSGTAATSGSTPATFTDLGTISNANSSFATALTGTSPAITSGAVQWFKLTVPTTVDGTAGSYLNLWASSAGANSVTDSVMSLYDNTGRHLAFDDDSGAGLFSSLTIGAPGAATPWAVNQFVGEESFSGKDGHGLAAGTYWIAVAPYHIGGTYADAFAFTSGSNVSFAGGVKLNVISNLPAPLMASQSLSGSLVLSDTGTFGSSLERYIHYTVRQDGQVVAGGMVTAEGPNSDFGITIPSHITGAVEITWDGSSFLSRKSIANLTGSNQELGQITMQNGDVDNNGEVDAADIDEVIFNFGATWPGGDGNSDADVDVSGEVDAADLDIIIANFGGAND
ncbi:MAG: hypothetical protein JNK63_10615 [Chthonomonas sp.]|nr:hypothetical protein [Chthonomonas sp.]